MKKSFKQYGTRAVFWLLAIIVISYLWFAALPDFFPTGGWDWLSFFGSILSLVGTVFLGLLVIWQNNKYTELADKKDEHYKNIDKEKARLENLPMFSINTNSIFEIFEKNRDGSFMKAPDNDKKYIISSRHVMLFDLIGGKIHPHNGYFAMEPDSFWVSFALVNCGNNTANTVNIFAKYLGSETLYPFIQTLSKDQTKYFFINLYQSLEETKTVELKINYFDIFQNQYEQTFQIIYYNKLGAPVTVCKASAPQVWLKKSPLFEA